MKRKKTSIVSVLALVCALAALILAAFGFKAIPEDQSHLIDDLYAENEELRQRLDALEDKVEQLMTAANLYSWTLDVDPWADSTGADVTLSAVPSGDSTNVRATLIVMLGQQQVGTEECAWNGSAFTATVSLNAMDGYSYYCQLTSPNGSQKLPLTDMEDAGAPVYLESSLSAYCNLVVNDWDENPGNNLVLTRAYAQVQLPLVGTDGMVEIAASDMVLQLNGEESVRIPLTLFQSEVESSYELTITDMQIPMPELRETDGLELFLEVVLSDGRRLSAFGISWHLQEGKLTSAVG